jgi:hypothetical protein
MAGALLIVGGGWLCIPGPNHLFETLQSSCRLIDGTTVRFYEGNGGATTAFSYLVTAQTRWWPWTERTVFWSYGEPVVSDVSCAGDRVTITATKGDWSFSNVTGVTRVISHPTWSLSAIDLAILHQHPITYHRGEPAPDLIHRGNWSLLEIVRTVIGAWSCAAGLVLLWFTWRLPNKPLERSGMTPKLHSDRASAGRSAPMR